MRAANERWARFVRGLVRHDFAGNQSALAQAIGVAPSTVTRWVDGATPAINALHAICVALGIPMVDLLVAAGALDTQSGPTQTESSMRHVTGTVADAIDDDPDLLPEAKAHLRNQYELLLRIDGRSPDLRKKSQARMESLRTDVRGQKRPREKEQERGTGTHGDD